MGSERTSLQAATLSGQIPKGISVLNPVESQQAGVGVEVRGAGWAGQESCCSVS